MIKTFEQYKNQIEEKFWKIACDDELIEKYKIVKEAEKYNL